LIYLDENKEIYSLFKVNIFSELDNAISSIAPSLCEYYLYNLISSLNNNDVLNKSNIQESLNVDNFTLYFAYDNNIYIELIKVEEDYSTSSLW